MDSLAWYPASMKSLPPLLSMVAFAIPCLVACSSTDDDAGSSLDSDFGAGGSMIAEAVGGGNGPTGGGPTSGGASSGGASSDTGGSGGEDAATGGGSLAGSSAGGADSASGGVDSASGDLPGDGGSPSDEGLAWPIDCIPDESCFDIGYPDTDDDGLAHDCGDPGYAGHQGTDISITWAQMDEGVAVRAAADGKVFFVADGKYDRCPNDTEPDCQAPPSFEAGAMVGTTVCTELGPYCAGGEGSCFWCFAGGNVVVLLHEGVDGVFATRYDHMKRDSILVSVGDQITRGQQLGQVGSAGNSTGPHLHFEVWADGYYDLADPWVGTCGPNLSESLWASEPPWL